MKAPDRFIFAVIVFLGSAMWLNFLTERLDASIFIAFLLTVLSELLLRLVYSRYKRLKKITVAEMLTYFATTSVAGEHFAKLLPPDTHEKTEGNFIIYKEKDAKKLLFTNFKFGDTSCDDVARCYRVARAEGITDVTVMSKGAPRAVLLYAYSLPLKLTFKGAKEVYKYLAKRGALPVPLVLQKKKVPLSFKNLFGTILSRKRVKYYAFTSVTLLVCALFTPLKLYYTILASISMSLAGLSLFTHVGQPN